MDTWDDLGSYPRFTVQVTDEPDGDLVEWLIERADELTLARARAKKTVAQPSSPSPAGPDRDHDGDHHGAQGGREGEKG